MNLYLYCCKDGFNIQDWHMNTFPRSPNKRNYPVLSTNRYIHAQHFR
ncbi:unnamed protein product [Acanthoscelides obtectus]|uniref:Uncharacterized protein n=1 Tax=Acanthoscelides obtectus TaxID=200917 RepID=A0A9P0PNZ9_ACAOB|nr:unnamed protein product [Acanthoscelides obtectus]CAH2015813.1 unnamed protein product [Acanthoscelides obtectus]CAK1679478.1 hypothetical protein AOBTE_LOCUS32277 [Acanthoscelides obtectus]CAK1679482.1 hypothetical protein AOBTE_LOCUS32281 [Acanthoscelides obtectus]